MTAEVIGELRKEATFGERQTLGLLRQNLPKEYSIYVETPIHKKRDFRYPDFVIVTNYGFIVLEVKDWVMVTGQVTPHGATVRMRNGETRPEHNPVGKAREFALAIVNEIRQRCKQGDQREIPWSYAALLFNLPGSIISQLRRPWGDEFVLGRDDLLNPDLLMNRLKITFPPERMRPLTKSELDLIRATIYPIVEIERPDQPSFVLDQQQEKIVAEPVFAETPSPSPKTEKKAAE